MLSTISPFFTNAAGTRVWPLTFTAIYGVNPLSAHHSQIARIRYGFADCSDMGKGYYRATPAQTTGRWITTLDPRSVTQMSGDDESVSNRNPPFGGPLPDEFVTCASRVRHWSAPR